MPSPRPERWRTSVIDADVATLDIPPALRARRFAIDIRFVVDCPAVGEAWHALTVELDGRREWSRRIATSNPGQTDSLDYHVTVDLPDGAGLRVRALTQLRGARRRSLTIEAEEQ